MNGSGYPYGLKGNDISIEARVLAVCEVFDDMTHCSYRGDNTTADDAVAELTSNRGTLYDRSIVNALLDVVNTDYVEGEALPEPEREPVAVGATRANFDDNPEV